MEASLIYPGMSEPVQVVVTGPVEEEGYEGFVWVQMSSESPVKVHESRLSV